MLLLATLKISNTSINTSSTYLYELKGMFRLFCLLFLNFIRCFHLAYIAPFRDIHYILYVLSILKGFQ